MSSIPEDLYLDILLRVPARSTFICKCVCKSWFSIISDPSFIRAHLNFSSLRDNSKNLLVGGYDKNLKEVIYSVSYDSLEPSPQKSELSLSKMRYPYKYLGYRVELIGSCDGLVCLVFHTFASCWDRLEEFFFCLWNPATKEYKSIKEPTNNFEYHDLRMCAFGYDHKNDDYKLVIAEDNKHGSSVYAYTLGSNAWKTDMEVPYRFFTDGISGGVLVNGGFHWLADEGCRQSKVIVSLDIRDVRFEELELPMELKDDHEHFCRFITEGVLEGCLCVLAAVGTGWNYPGPVQAWVMQDYGVGESWTKRYTIRNEIIIRISDPWSPTRTLSFVCCFKNGEILFKTFPGKLVLYDPKDGSAIERDIKICDFRSKVIYSESLVSVNSGTYVRKGGIVEFKNYLKQKKPNKKNMAIVLSS